MKNIEKSTLFITLALYVNIAHANINEYIPLLYEVYKTKEHQCLTEAAKNKAAPDEIHILKMLDSQDVNAYAIKKGIDHKIGCTSKELVQLLHTGWAAHEARNFDKTVNDFDHLLDRVVDIRYLQAIIHLGGVPNKTINKLDSIEYFQKPFDIESRPWE